MFLCQQIESVPVVEFGYRRFRYHLLVYRVELATDGRPAWKLHRTHKTWHTLANCRKWGKGTYPNVPFIDAARHNKPVSMAEAERLTGIRRPAALDYLAERVLAGVAEVENYVKPKPVKEPKPEPIKVPPTAAEVADAKVARANAKVLEWSTQVAHAEAKLKEWQRKARRLAKRAEKLRQVETSSP